jgi:hypothetical protein
MDNLTEILMLQFLRKFDVSLRDENSAGEYTVVGGVSYWKDMYLNVKPRRVAVGKV